MPGSMDEQDPSKIVDTYLRAFYSGDFEAARAVVADEFSFQGPFLQIEGKDGFFDGAEGLRRIVTGHRLLRRWQDGPDVCSWYDVEIKTPTGRGSILMSEWHTVRQNRLVSGRVVFDTADFRALVPTPAT